MKLPSIAILDGLCALILVGPALSYSSALSRLSAFFVESRKVVSLIHVLTCRMAGF